MIGTIRADDQLQVMRLSYDRKLKGSTMPEEVSLVITEIRASVEILGSKQESWGTEIMARAVDHGSNPADPSQLAYAVGLAYRQKHSSAISQQQTIMDVKAECVLPNANDSHAWYVHIKLWDRNGTGKNA